MFYVNVIIYTNLIMQRLHKRAISYNSTASRSPTVGYLCHRLRVAEHRRSFTSPYFVLSHYIDNTHTPNTK